MNTTPTALEAMLAQYEKNNTPAYTKNENAVEFNTNNYFGTFLEPKETSAKKTIRILPTTDGSSPFVEMHGHKAKVDGEFKTFACLKTEKQTDCPFCEARAALLATGKESDKELAKAYNTKKMYVVKVIDRNHEDHGVKFWRFNHDYRKTGILDKIVAILQIAKDITDVNTGRDLQITIARDQNNNPVVQAIVAFDPTPLSTDKVQLDTWLSDTKVWENVYSVRNYEYLEIVVKGGIPVWDKVEKKFVDKASQKADDTQPVDSELSLGVQNVKAGITTAQPTATSVAPAPVAAQTSEEDGDDLPF